MKTCEYKSKLMTDLGTSAIARTVTTSLVALASVVVMALAGCASPRGIESKATLIAPTSARRRQRHDRRAARR